MPLRDHFRLPTTKYGSWESLHGGWPMVIIQQLRKQLPPGFVAAPCVHISANFDIDVPSFVGTRQDRVASIPIAKTTLATPKPTWVIETDVPDEDIYEVQIFKVEQERELVAVIEIVSPGNKDRPDKRRAFVDKCGALLRKGIAVSIVDLVTIRHANLYAEMMISIGHPDPNVGLEPEPMYASSCRWTTNAEGTAARLEAWYNPMILGQVLPSLPIWLSESQSLSFDLERSYEQACEDLSIP